MKRPCGTLPLIMPPHIVLRLLDQRRWTHSATFDVRGKVAVFVESVDLSPQAIGLAIFLDIAISYCWPWSTAIIVGTVVWQSNGGWQPVCIKSGGKKERSCALSDCCLARLHLNSPFHKKTASGMTSRIIATLLSAARHGSRHAVSRSKRCTQVPTP